MPGQGAAPGEDDPPGWTPVVLAVLRHPSVWLVVLRQSVRLVPSRWWARGAHLPVPDPAYLRFRTLTADGGDGRTAPDAEELIAWLRWSRSWPAAVR
jgi:hypothetical protein